MPNTCLYMSSRTIHEFISNISTISTNLNVEKAQTNSMSGVYDIDQPFGCWNRNISAEVCQCHGYWRPGLRFTMKMTSYQYRKSHCGDKTILRPSYLHNGISYTSYVVMEFIGSFSFQGRISTIYVALSCWKMEENWNMLVWCVKKPPKKQNTQTWLSRVTTGILLGGTNNYQAN